MTPSAFGASNLASTTSFSTASTTDTNLGTTTVDFSAMPTGLNHITFFFHSSTTAPIAAATKLCAYFNTYTGVAEYAYNAYDIRVNNTATADTAADDVVCFTTAEESTSFSLTGEIMNVDGIWKSGTARFHSSTGINGAENVSGVAVETWFTWKKPQKITSISFVTDDSITKYSTTTYMFVNGY